MKNHRGTYVGVVPCAGSLTGFGEAEAVIDDEKISFRIATGEGIQCESLFLSGFEKMGDEELGVTDAVTEALPQLELYDMAGFRHASGLPSLLFVAHRSYGDGAMFLFSDGLESLFGPSPFFNAVSVESGQLELCISEIDKDSSGGRTPRLAYGGRPPNEAMTN